MFTELPATDGHTLQCWIEPAQGARKGGIVILQEIFGVTEQLKGSAARYAALEYEAAIPALFDRTEKGAVVDFSDAPRGRDMMLASDLSQTMMDNDDAARAMGDRVGVIGFCWGGGLAIHAAQVLDVAYTVAFYGTRLPQYLDHPLRAPVMGHFGTTDDHTPPDVVADAQAALPRLEVHWYEAGHAFANDARPSYVADAADLAHQRTEAFLASRIG